MIRKVWDWLTGKASRLGRAVSGLVRRIDKWDVITLTGSLLFGVGVEMRFGKPWALMFWGGMLITLAVANSLNQRPKGQE
jgi:hypothetical protein